MRLGGGSRLFSLSHHSWRLRGYEGSIQVHLLTGVHVIRGCGAFDPGEKSMLFYIAGIVTASIATYIITL
jgi:hypothetical protein